MRIIATATALAILLTGSAYAQQPQPTAEAPAPTTAPKLERVDELDQENIRLHARIAQLEEQVQQLSKALKDRLLSERAAEFVERVQKGYDGKYEVDPATLQVKEKAEAPKK